MDKPQLDKPQLTRSQADETQPIDRTRRLLVEMREAIENARRSVLASRNLLNQFPERAASAEPPASAAGSDAAAEAEDVTLHLVDVLLHAHSLTNLDDDSETRTLLEKALLRVGHRLAQRAGPRAAGLVLQ